jgi:hypothetical protein
MFKFSFLVRDDETLVSSLLQESVHFKYKSLNSILLLFVSSPPHCNDVATTECHLRSKWNCCSAKCVHV